MARHRRSACQAAVIASIFLFQTGAFAQPSEKNLVLVVRTQDDLDQDEIESAMRDGVNQTPGCKVTDIRVEKEKSRFFHFEYFRKTGGDAANVTNGVVLQPIPSAAPETDLLWEFRLKDRTDILKKLKVTFKKAGTKEYEPKNPAADPQAPLTLTSLGRYAFRPEPGDDPIDYELAIVRAGQKDEPAVKGKWPRREYRFVITLEKFSGNHEALFKTLEDGSKVNPVLKLARGPEEHVVFGDISTDALERKQFVQGTDLVIQEVAPTAKSVWIMLPLGQENYKSDLQKYLDLKGRKLLEEVERNKADRVGLSSEARWFKLQRKPNHFEVRIPLGNMLELEKKYPRLWYLLVWEHENGTAIKIRHPESKARVPVLEEEWRGWGAELRAAIEREKGKGK